MTQTIQRRIPARQPLGLMSLVVALTLLATACGGDGNDDAQAPFLDEQPAEQQIDSGSGGIAVEGPVEGLLTVQPSFGYGVYVVDEESGLGVALPGIDSIDTVDRNRDVILNDGAAFTLGAKTRDGQTFASDISVVKIDLATGRSAALAPLGFDRETDDSDTSISHVLQAVSPDALVVEQTTFGQADRTYRIFDPISGQELSSFPDPRYSFESDQGACSGGASDLVGLTDGRIAGVALGSPAIVDTETGEIELMIGCDADTPQLDSFVEQALFDRYAVVNVDGPTPTDEDIVSLLQIDLEPKYGFVEGDGDLWWIDINTRTSNGVQAIVGGIVQFDLDDQVVEAVYPLSEFLGSYNSCAPDSDECVIQTAEQSELRYVDGRLIMAGIGENAPVLILDPATSALTAVEITTGAGVDFTTVNLLAGEPDEVWLRVSRMTITKDDDTGRLSGGPVFLERLNPETGQIEFSADVADLFS